MVCTDPFPHMVVSDALPPALFDALRKGSNAFDGALSRRYKGPNRYHRLSSSELLSGDLGEVPRCWQDFVRDHVAPEFFQAGLRLFASSLGTARASIEPMLGRAFEQCAVAARFQGTGDVHLDCQFVRVSPAVERGSPLGPHLDREVALWGGLLYLGDGDGGGGGDLVLYRFREPDRREYWRDRSIPGSLLTISKVIAAKPNTFVMFLNSPDSVHGVTPREPGGAGRDLVNFVCEFNRPHFSIEPWRVQVDRFAPVC